MTELAYYPLSVVFVVSLLLIAADGEFGHWLGQHTSDCGENITTLKAVILGLLTVLIGFTFAMAQARFELRRDSV